MQLDYHQREVLIYRELASLSNDTNQRGRYLDLAAYHEARIGQPPPHRDEVRRDSATGAYYEIHR